MKNWKKITLITGTVCTILGFFLLIFGLFAGGIQYLTSTDLGSFNNSDKSAAKVQKLVTEELSPYKNLDVSLDSLNLQKIIPMLFHIKILRHLKRKAPLQLPGHSPETL